MMTNSVSMVDSSIDPSNIRSDETSGSDHLFNPQNCGNPNHPWQPGYREAPWV
jgi:hypothetical protein